MTSRSVIVTGGCGFVGRQAVPRLIARGFEVHVLSRSGSGRGRGDLQGARIHQVDLHDAERAVPLVRGIGASHLLHLAWDTRHGIFWSSPENLDWIVSSKLLVNAFIEGGGTRIVAAGTCAEYDWETGDERLVEGSSKLQPATLYGQCKLAARKSLFTVAEHHKVSAAWGRIFFLFGPHEGTARLVSSASVSLLQGEPFPASIGDQVRDFSFVGDVAEGFVALLDSSVTGDVNIASGEPRSVASILGALGKITGRPELLQLGAKPKVANEPATIVASVERLRREVGTASPPSIDERLSETVDWWRHELRLK